MRRAVGGAALTPVTEKLASAGMGYTRCRGLGHTGAWDTFFCPVSNYCQNKAPRVVYISLYEASMNPGAHRKHQSWPGCLAWHQAAELILLSYPLQHKTPIHTPPIFFAAAQDLRENYEAGHVCWDDEDLLRGQPTGAVRASLGHVSAQQDVQALIWCVPMCLPGSLLHQLAFLVLKGKAGYQFSFSMSYSILKSTTNKSTYDRGPR